MGKNRIGMILLIAGVGLNLLDDFTGTTSNAGVVYGANGFLASVNAMLPGGLVVGDALAGVGIVLLWMEHGL
jgi:hypothetical protein